MNHFFSPWMLLALLAGPVLLAWRFVRLRSSAGDLPALGTAWSQPRRCDPLRLPQAVAPPSALALPPSARPPSAFPFRLPPLAAAMIALAVAMFTAAIYWDPSGGRKEGRVMVVERHSQWEPTTKPYDTTWFAEPPLMGEASGYNYALLYQWLGQFYRMSRLLEEDKIDDKSLANCDVLVIKIPTARYARRKRMRWLGSSSGAAGCCLSATTRTSSDRARR